MSIHTSPHHPFGFKWRTLYNTVWWPTLWEAFWAQGLKESRSLPPNSLWIWSMTPLDVLFPVMLPTPTLGPCKKPVLSQAQNFPHLQRQSLIFRAQLPFYSSFFFWCLVQSGLFLFLKLAFLCYSSTALAGGYSCVTLTPYPFRAQEKLCCAT